MPNRLSQSDRYFVDAFATRIVQEIGVKKYNKIVEEVTGLRITSDPIKCQVGPYCALMCHLFGVSCKARPCPV